MIVQWLQIELLEMRERAKENSRRKNKRRRILLERQRKRQLEEANAQIFGSAVQLVPDEIYDDPTAVQGPRSPHMSVRSHSSLNNEAGDMQSRAPQGNSISIKINDEDLPCSPRQSTRSLRSLNKEISLESSESGIILKTLWFLVMNG